LGVFQKISCYLARVAPEELFRLLIQNMTDLSSAASRHSTTSPTPSGSEQLPGRSESAFNALFPLEKSSHPLIKRDLSVLLLSDVIVEHPGVAEKYLAELLHTLFMVIDHENPLVYRGAKKFLENFVVTYVVNHFPENSPQARCFQTLRQRLDQSGDEPLWANEYVTLQRTSLPSFDHLASMVELLIRALSKDHLREDWGSLALSWAIKSHSEHTVGRSFQLYRSLRIPLSSEDLKQIINRLSISVITRSPVNIQIAVEIMETLKIGAKYTAKKTLCELPQLFWAAVAMLHTAIPFEYSCAVELVSVLVDTMHIHEAEMQTALLKTLPQRWVPPFDGILSLLLKGMCSRKTELAARNLLAKLAGSPCVHILHTDPELRILSNLIGLLPQLISMMGREDTLEIARELAKGFLLHKYEDFAKLFLNYSHFTYSSEGMRRFLHENCKLIAKYFFPKYEIFVFSVLLEIMGNGPSVHQRAILTLISLLLEHVQIDNSALNTTYVPLFGSVTKLLNSGLWQETLNVFKVILRDSSPAQEFSLKQSKLLGKSALEKLQSDTHTWDRPVTLEPLHRALQEAIDPTINENPPEAFLIPPDFEMPALNTPVGRSGQTRFTDISPAESRGKDKSPDISVKWGSAKNSQLRESGKISLGSRPSIPEGDPSELGKSRSKEKRSSRKVKTEGSESRSTRKSSPTRAHRTSSKTKLKDIARQDSTKLDTSQTKDSPDSSI